MAVPRQHQGLLALALVIAILAIATFLATKSKASQLKSFSGGGTSSNNMHQVLLKSVNISDTASHNKHSIQPVNDYGMRSNGGNGRIDVGSKVRDAGELKKNMNDHEQRISNADGKISGINRESKMDSISGDEASDDDDTDDDETDDDDTDDNVGELDDEKTDDDET